MTIKRKLALFLAVLTVLVTLTACGRGSEIDPEPPRETTAPVPHETLFPPESDSVKPADSDSIFDPDVPDISELQAICDKGAREIIEYIQKNTPVYKKEVEMPPSDSTDGAADEKVYEEYTPYVSFYYEDLSSGATMSYEADTIRYSASLIKMPYILWALKKVEAAEASPEFKEGGTFDVNRIFIYQKEHYREGSGVILKSEYGTEYSYLDLLRLTVTKSDNVAFAQLRREYGTKDFRAYCEEIGVKSPQKSLYDLSPRECAVFLREAYDYFESGSKYAGLLKSWMQKTNHRILIPQAVSAPVANKYGWDKKSYHDMGIVLCEKPYILIIMTGLENGTAKDNSFIRSVAKKVEAVHNEINPIT